MLLRELVGEVIWMPAGVTLAWSYSREVTFRPSGDEDHSRWASSVLISSLSQRTSRSTDSRP